jgi:hypothetical protein
MTRTAISLLLAVLTASLLVTLAVMAQQEEQPPTDFEAEVRSLQIKRFETLEALVQNQTIKYREGHGDLQHVLAAHHDRTEAQLELVETPEKRIALLEAQLEVAKETLQMAQALFEAAERDRCDPLQAQASSGFPFQTFHPEYLCFSFCNAGDFTGNERHRGRVKTTRP